MLDKRKMLKQIRQRWNSPEKLLEYISDLDKQQGLEIELAYKRGMKETVRNYSILFVYTLRKSGFGKRTLPLLIENINTISKQLENEKLDIEKMDSELKKIGINLI